MVVSDSAASRNSVVATALPFSASTGTSTKDCLKVWTIVPPGGMTGADILAVGSELKLRELEGIEGLGRQMFNEMERGQQAVGSE